MADSTTTATPQVNGAAQATTAPLNKKQKRAAKQALAAAAKAAGAPAKAKVDAKVYATRDECEKAGRPQTDNPEAWKVFGVTSPDGKTTRWLWSTGNVNALATVAKADGNSASSAGSPKTVSPQAAAAKLLALSDAELATLGLKRG